MLNILKITFVLFYMLAFTNMTNCKEIPVRIYVSSSEGFDTSSGSDSLRPMRDINKALAKAEVVMLKAGDVFYVSEVEVVGKTLTRYGEGSNPTICGFKRIIEPRWLKVGENLWRLNLSEDNYTGFDTKGSSHSNNICAFYEYDKDLLHGRKVWHKDEMKDEWDFWQTETLSEANPEEYDYVYLYLTENPNRLKIEMSVYDMGLKMKNATVEGINLKGFGFGISAKTHSQIRNCEVDIIGGRIIPEGDSYVCYGNGIEFWVSTPIEDCIVENSIISRCYDCGVTIQGPRNGKYAPRNIFFRNNLIKNCCQGWEDFLNNDVNIVYDNCVFENNIVVSSGDIGFGYSPERFKYCHVLGNNIFANKGMIIRNNTFVGGNFYCSGAYNGEYKSNVWEGNICVIKRGDFILSNYRGTKDVIRIPTKRGEFRNIKVATDDAIRRYRKLTGDETTKFVIINEKQMNRRIIKFKKKYLGK